MLAVENYYARFSVLLSINDNLINGYVSSRCSVVLWDRIMKKMTFSFIWFVSFLLLLLVGDQFLLRYPGKDLPLLNDFQQFYQDFRQRLIKLEAQRSTPPKDTATTVEEVLAIHVQEVTKATSAADEIRYLYLDDHGTLNFADRLDEVPPVFRHSAKPLEQ
ncbi:MAG: hypothetical protein B6I37_08275 [Desulfobacteraceae bacterium 4572_35.2]|nr:MAG: hypothetical protein B6I37_08275 [Desulfobacteraceae bacterium 4572_35.2]